MTHSATTHDVEFQPTVARTPPALAIAPRTRGLSRIMFKSS
jgi:hypothetical protein